MDVIDDIKDKIGGRNSNSADIDSGLDSSLEDTGFQNNQTGKNSNMGSQVNETSGLSDNSKKPENSQRSQELSGNSRNRGMNSQNTRNNGKSLDNSTRPNDSQKQNKGRQSRRGSSPNPQTGRPQPGQDSPQISNNTRKKMQNAGMDPGNPQTVSNNQSDMEEIKRQNEQIIDLLKRLNQTLNSI